MINQEADFQSSLEAASYNGEAPSIDEKDALGEIANICMGTSATTLSTLLGRKVTITAPKVMLSKSAGAIKDYQKPFVAVEVSYTSGVDAYSVLMMKDEDVQKITSLLLGSESSEEIELDELHLSTIGEVMNQMVGSASTSLSDILGVPVGISPPTLKRILLEEESMSQLICNKDTTVIISFSMIIEDLLESEIMQILPVGFGKRLANVLLKGVESKPEPEVQKARPAPEAPMHAAMAAPRQRAPEPSHEKSRVSVKAMHYEHFDEPSLSQNVQGSSGGSLNLILDVPLQVTVELGQCKKSIKEILAFNIGSVIVLNKLAGEMVDVLVNGKLFARGEVVVIDDNYGVRVTEIIANAPASAGAQGVLPF